MEAVYYGRPME